MKLSDDAIKRVKEAIRHMFNWRKELPSYWEDFVNNLASNTNNGVFLAVQTLLFKSFNDNKYFSPVKGVNIATNGLKDLYNPNCFKGYLGFGKFRGELLNTDLVFRYLNKVGYEQILRIDIRNKLANKKINIIKNDNYECCNDTKNILYFARYMQYCVDKNTNGTSAIANGFEKTIANLLLSLGHTLSEDYNKIGAIEFILPEDIGNGMPETSTAVEQLLLAQYLYEAIHK